MIPHTRREYIEVDSSDLEELINSTYGWRDGWLTFAKAEGDQDYWIFDVHVDEYPVEFVEEGVNTLIHAYNHNNRCPEFRTNMVLNDLCIRGLIDNGHYLIAQS